MDSEEAVYVVNIPGRGYCFVAAITVEKDLPPEAAGGAPERERNLPDHLTPRSLTSEL
jgi:hypothetical protein